ncbi:MULTISPECIES: hypothetical protein [Ignavibacterium]|jgi:hypothetical protein|uniref:hypothetical protein n=1 Tax=Ignavibacterium TaxID=795750 RepID=UPI0025C6D7D7|nr:MULTISPECIES: hypothetical protein [Ignavibacterium]MBI5663137.1 hypothetical protein [Ignavibacterium album]
MNIVITYFTLIFISFNVVGLSSDKLKKKGNEYSFLNMKSISGLLTLEGDYRTGTYNFSGFFLDKQQSHYLTGRLDLNTSSFIWHPNFFQLDANFSYSPIKSLDSYVVSPDNSEIRTTERVDLNGIFFSERIITLIPYFNFNHSFSKREYSTNIESFYKNYGARLLSTNSILPFNFNISQNNWNENEFHTGRDFNTNQFSVNTEINRSFNDFNFNRLNIDYFNYTRKYSSLATIQNKAINWSLNNNFTLNRSSNFKFASLISVINQVGSQPVKKLLVNETLISDLPSGFSIYGRYQYTKFNQDLVESKQQQIEARIEHQLFNSLRSYLSYSNVIASQTFFNEKIQQGEIGFDYQKNIPTGVLRLNYNLALSRQKRDNVYGDIIIVDESKLLSEGTVATLNYPYVDRNSIVVKNSSGTVLYQENFDYIIIQRGIYTEIQRIIGGQIANGEIVLISYKAKQQPSLYFDSKINRYGASLTLIKNLLEIYFNGTDQIYSNFSEVNSEYLKTLNQRLYGFKISYEYFDIGAEYENYRSNISPYTSNRYSLRFYEQIGDNILATLNGNYRIYNLIDESIEQSFADATIILTYFGGSNSKLTFEANHIFQEGKKIDLNLRSLNIEFTTAFRQIDISVGYENYNRKLFNDQTKYSGIYAKLGRKF